MRRGDDEGEVSRLQGLLAEERTQRGSQQATHTHIYTHTESEKEQERDRERVRQ